MSRLKQTRKRQRQLEREMFGPELRAPRARKRRAVVVAQALPRVVGGCPFCGGCCEPVGAPWSCPFCGVVYPAVRS